jgi:hypothetical protein
MALAIAQTLAFAPSSSSSFMSTNFKSSPTSTRTHTSLNMNMMDMTPMSMPMEMSILSNSNTISASTVDPTTMLSQVLGGLLGSPIILLVPILAAVSVATVIAWLIVAYANPADPDDDDL